MQLFVEDLLNLKMLNDGIFSFVQQSFDPNELFINIIETFGPLVSSKKIELNFALDHKLEAPQKDESLAQRPRMSQD